MRIHNFSPGPAILPESVLAEAAESLKSYKKTGLSIVEISHRSPVFLEIIEEATAIIKDLYSIKDDLARVVEGSTSLAEVARAIDLTSRAR